MTHQRRIVLAVLAALSIAAWKPAETRAQAILLDVGDHLHRRLPRPWRRPEPAPAATYRLESLEVDASLEGAVARVVATQTFKNTGDRTIEAAFLFPLPYDGAIDRLTLLVNGKELEAKLLGKQEARRRYEEIVRQSRDPALLEWIGAGMFQTSVFPIPPGESRTVSLRYTQVCRQSHGLTDFLFPLSTARYTSEPVQQLKLRVAIASPAPLKNVYSPTHAIEIERTDPRHAVIKHEQTDVIPGEDFRLFFDADGDDVRASLISYRPDKSEEGYFLLLASPDMKGSEQVVPKTVVFVVDRSGSMSGEKIEQARNAAKFVLNNLREGDLFNIVAYDSEIDAFRPELQRYDAQSRSAALGFINSLHAGGSTNLNAALVRSLEMCQDGERPSYVLFLTDGLPTMGTTDESTIASHAEKANRVRARLFAFGVGYDVNSRLLDKLSHQNFGQSEYVRPDQDIEARVSSLYRRIGSPVLTSVELKLELPGAEESAGPAVSRVYPTGEFDLFAGDQAVLVGRYRQGGAGTLHLTGTLEGKPQTYPFAVELADLSNDDSHAFVARLWATRRVGEIIDQIDLSGKNDELMDELVRLAKKHGILTPYTSFLADETSEARSASEVAKRVDLATDALAESEGAWGFRQREAKAAFQRAAAPTAGRTYALGSEASGADREEYFEQLSLSDGRGVRYYDAEADRQQIAAAVCTAGRKTFFRIGNHWMDTAVTDEDRAAAIALERFSPEYFALLEQHGEAAAAYLAIDAQVTVKLDGQTYQW